MINDLSPAAESFRICIRRNARPNYNILTQLLLHQFSPEWTDNFGRQNSNGKPTDFCNPSDVSWVRGEASRLRVVLQFV